MLITKSISNSIGTIHSYTGAIQTRQLAFNGELKWTELSWTELKDRPPARQVAIISFN